ncbi:MAG: NnrS family protein [Mariprofundaceae bacterium]
MSDQTSPWLALGFRPFFLAAGVFAVLSMLIFMLGYQTGIWHYNYFELSLWHAHEMLFGYTSAVIAGFLLTAVRNWTGVDTLTGRPLLMLLLLWLAGRLVVLVAFAPEWLTALVDVSFLCVLTVVIALPIIKAQSKRNYLVPVLLLVMAGGNAFVYAGLFEILPNGELLGLWIGMGAVLFLLSVIAGRVVPFFTERGLSGVSSKRYVWVEWLSMPSLVVWLVVEVIFPNQLVSVVCAVIAAVVHGIRLYGWGHRKVWSEPMLWVIYLAYAWLIVALLMFAWGEFQLYAMHAMTAGMIGMFTLGMMARVGLGHTGRPIQASRIVVLAFVCVFAASVSRVVLPMVMPAWAEWSVLLAACFWMVGFSMFVWVYLPVLLKVRIDGKPG